LLSRTQEYALRAAVFLGRSYGEGPLRTSELAKRTGIPRNYLSKVLHQMARNGLVDSERGRHGGVALSRDPAKVTLQEIIVPFQPAHEPKRCVLGRPECSDEFPCGAHESWKKIKEQTEAFFETTSIADVMDETPLP
jgi:Rrf2 family protein